MLRGLRAKHPIRRRSQAGEEPGRLSTSPLEVSPGVDCIQSWEARRAQLPRAVAGAELALPTWRALREERAGAGGAYAMIKTS